MSNQQSSSSHLPNFTFFDEKWSHISTHKNSTDPAIGYQSEASPLKKINANSKDVSFSTHNPYMPPVSNNTKSLLKDNAQNFKSNPAPTQASSKQFASQTIRNKSPLIRRSPSGGEFLLGRYSEYIEETASELKAYEKLIKPREEAKDVPLVEVHVSDIRRRMRSYHPMHPTDDGQKNMEANFQELNSRIEQEIKKGKREQMTNLDLKAKKKQGVDELFDRIREESNRRIHDIVQNLRMIRKQDVQFHDKVTGELKELNFLRNELTKGFEKLQQKNSMENNEKITKTIQKKLLSNCENCCHKKDTIQNDRSLTDRSCSPQTKHFRTTSHTISHTHREREKSEDVRGSLLSSEPHLGKEEEIYRKDGRRVLERASSVSKVSAFDLRPPEKEDGQRNNNPSRVTRKYFVAFDQNKQLRQRERDATKNWINKSRSGSIDISYDGKNTDHSYSYLSKEGPYRKEDEQRSSELSRITENHQGIPERWFVKLSKSPFTYGNFTLKFTAANLTFDVELKMNDTAEIDLSKKFLSAKVASNHAEGVCSRSHFGTSKLDGETKIDFERGSHSQNLLQKKNNISELAMHCHDCSNKIEGMKATLQAFTDIDQRISTLDASYTENLLKLLTKDVEKEDHQSTEEEIKNYLKRACRGIEVFLDSCFDMAPFHAQKIEKLFKGLLFFFELKVRAYVQSQNSFLREIEEGNFLLKEKKKICDEVLQLKDEKEQLAEDLKNAHKRNRDLIVKYEEQIKVLLKKIEEQRGLDIKQIGIKDSSRS